MIGVFINVIFPVLLILAFGFAVGKLFDLNVKTLSTLSIYLLSPALIFQAIYRYENIFSDASLKMLLVITIITILIIASIEIISKILKIPRSTKSALILTLMLSNSGNFGLPINEYAYGEEAFFIASIIMVIYSFYTNSVGVFVAASDKTDMKTGILKMLKVPLLYAMAIALILNYYNVKIPDQIFKPIKTVGMSAIPINLIQLGINLSLIKLNKKNIITILAASITKLTLIPFVSYFLLKLIGLEGINFKVTLTQIAMPSAVYSSILTSHFEGDHELTSGIVLVSSLLSLISLSALITFLSGG